MSASQVALGEALESVNSWSDIVSAASDIGAALPNPITAPAAMLAMRDFIENTYGFAIATSAFNFVAGQQRSDTGVVATRGSDFVHAGDGNDTCSTGLTAYYS